jgi:hypothetical protein
MAARYFNNREETMYDDSALPFEDGDDLPKPSEGDILVTKRMLGINRGSQVVIVSNTFDSLAESWDPDGEAAWAQHDVNDLHGHRGHWYAMVYEESREEEAWSVASWEVARNKSAEKREFLFDDDNFTIKSDGTTIIKVTNSDGSVWEFDYIVGQMADENDKMVFRKLGDESWADWPEEWDERYPNIIRALDEIWHG